MIRHYFPFVFTHLQVSKHVYFNRSSLHHILINCPHNLRKMALHSYTSNQVFLSKAHHSVRQCIRVAIHGPLQYCRLEPSAMDNEVLTPWLTLQMNH